MRGTQACLGLMLSVLAAACATTGPGSNDSAAAPASAGASKCEANTASRIRRCDSAGVRSTTPEGLEDAGLISSRPTTGQPPSR